MLSKPVTNVLSSTAINNILLTFVYLNSVCVIDGCEVRAYWLFRHRLLHQTNNSYHNIIQILLKTLVWLGCITQGFLVEITNKGFL